MPAERRFLLATLFYLVYPLLVGVTPEGVFTEPFGGLVTVNFWTMASCWMPWVALDRVHGSWLRRRRVAAQAGTTGSSPRSLLAPTRAAELASCGWASWPSPAPRPVDTQAAELRRIERDLHDGAQARLVALGMRLGLAEEWSPAIRRRRDCSPRPASPRTALVELRDLVRGIHPPVLADRGLDGAVRRSR